MAKSANHDLLKWNKSHWLKPTAFFYPNTTGNDESWPWRLKKFVKADPPPVVKGFVHRVSNLPICPFCQRGKVWMQKIKNGKKSPKLKYALRDLFFRTLTDAVTTWFWILVSSRPIRNFSDAIFKGLHLNNISVSECKKRVLYTLFLSPHVQVFGNITNVGFLIFSLLYSLYLTLSYFMRELTWNEILMHMVPVAGRCRRKVGYLRHLVSVTTI